MTDTPSKAREHAESAFGKTQSQFLARSRVVSEQDAVVQARDEKTVRLRELRMAKEAGDMASTPSSAPVTKRAAKR